MTDFSQKQAKHIRQLLTRKPAHVNEVSPEGFLLLYVFFEALLKLVGRYYRETQRPQRKQPTGKEPLNINQVKKWLMFFQMTVHHERLGLLLDSKRTNRRQKSARELRNGLVHSWNAGDYAEVVERFPELKVALTGVVESVAQRVGGNFQ